MKICSLFMNVACPEGVGWPRDFVAGLREANAALPQESIRYALNVLKEEKERLQDAVYRFSVGSPHRREIQNRLSMHDEKVQNLRALLTSEAPSE